MTRLYCVRLRYPHRSEVTYYYTTALLRQLAIIGYGVHAEILCTWEE